MAETESRHGLVNGLVNNNSGLGVMVVLGSSRCYRLLIVYLSWLSKVCWNDGRTE